METMDKNSLSGGAKMQHLVLVGNPNVGKSVIFGRLTGQYVTVSNYPGTTVDVSRGQVWISSGRANLTDSPGVLSLFPRSEDEQVTRDLLIREQVDAVIQVADAKNLQRALLITMELAMLQLPMILVLNMSDEARGRGIEIDVERLSKMLGVPVIECVATTGEGLAEIRKAISKAAVCTLQYSPLAEIKSAAQELRQILPEKVQTSKGVIAFSCKDFVIETLFHNDANIWRTLQILTPDFAKNDFALQKKVQNLSQEISKRFARSISLLSLHSRQQKAKEVSAEVIQVTGILKSSWAQKFGQLSIRPWPGYLILLAVLYVMYWFVGVFGAQTLVGLLEEKLFENILNPAVVRIVEWAVPWTWMQEIIVGPYGLFTMALTYALALIFPIVTCFFLFFGVLEDSGYLPRLAILLDRVFRVMGLNGKAVLPMILGLGCDTMATLTTRVLDSRKEKIIVCILLTLSVPCSAQLGAMLGMIAGLSWKVLAIWLFVVCSTMVAVGWGASKILPGARSPFLMEIPPIRIPQFGNLLKKIRARLKWYLKEALPMFMLGTFILYLLDKLFILEWMKKAGAPLVVHFLGLPADATESFIIGFLRRDYGAAGFFSMAQAGRLSPEQITVALVVITLFMPCIAQLFVTIKERGLKTALMIASFVMVFALLVGGLVHQILKSGLIQL